MEFKLMESERLKEKVFYAKHSSGLQIYVAPKKGYSSQYAIFGTKYGSIDNCFKADGEEITVPEGIAHFLEHKLFESEDGDAFSRYARTGASANAYTSFDKTCYLFSSTSNFEKSLEILLDFVQKPYFTEKTVQKEQGIIGQEIKMYDDDPGWRVFFNLLRAIYHNHPVKIDIAGTTDSIAQITSDLLYQCYHSFYNLHNMVLCISGDVDPQRIAETADRMLHPSEDTPAVSIFQPEPESIVEPRVEQKLSVSVPLFNLGFKDTPAEGIESAKKEVITSILTEIIGGDSSPFYRRLYDRGLINASFSMQYFSGRSFAATVIGGESHNPDLVAEEFMKEIQALKESGISKSDFDRAKKTVYGRLIAQFDSIDEIANNLAASHFAGIGPFTLVDVSAQITLQDVTQRLTDHFRTDNHALSVILPLDSKES